MKAFLYVLLFFFGLATLGSGFCALAGLTDLKNYGIILLVIGGVSALLFGIATWGIWRSIVKRSEPPAPKE